MNIKDFKIIGILGVGAGGITFDVRDDKLRKEYAMKVFCEELDELNLHKEFTKVIDSNEILSNFIPILETGTIAYTELMSMSTVNLSTLKGEDLYKWKDFKYRCEQNIKPERKDNIYYIIIDKLT